MRPILAVLLTAVIAAVLVLSPGSASGQAVGCGATDRRISADTVVVDLRRTAEAERPCRYRIRYRCSGDDVRADLRYRLAGEPRRVTLYLTCEPGRLTDLVHVTRR